MKEIFKQYVDLLADVDHWFASCSALFGNKVYCKYGCSECCHGLHDITLLDAAYLRSGFESLPQLYQQALHHNACSRLVDLQKIIPKLSSPYILNYYPEDERDRLIAEETETHCILLGYDGNCLLYDYRPLTCRLHGLPLIDNSGAVIDDSWCTLNFPGQNPLILAELRGNFAELFRRKTILLDEFNMLVTGIPTTQLWTLIPAALVIDFSAHYNGFRRLSYPH